MIRHLIAIAGAMSIGSSHAAAQSTEDGIDAFLRGDYEHAVRTFESAAASSQPPDHTAEFFLATMYENGLGVVVDRVRACSLYARAAADDKGLFAAAAGVLMDVISRQLTPDEIRKCQQRVSADGSPSARSLSAVTGASSDRCRACAPFPGG